MPQHAPASTGGPAGLHTWGRGGLWLRLSCVTEGADPAMLLLLLLLLLLLHWRRLRELSASLPGTPLRGQAGCSTALDQPGVGPRAPLPVLVLQPVPELVRLGPFFSLVQLCLHCRLLQVCRRGCHMLSLGGMVMCGRLELYL